MTKWIAVADDDITTLKVAGRILNNNNLRISAMNSGMALLSFLKENKPDLILIDADMIGMNGVDTLKLMREQEKKKGTKATPVIMLKSQDDTESEGLTSELNVAAYIQKPITPDALLEVIGKVINISGCTAENKCEEQKADQPIDHTGVEVDDADDLEHFNRKLREKEDPNTALWVDNKAFSYIYRFFARYIASYKAHACKVLFTFSELKEIDGLEKDFSGMMEDFGDILKNILRKSDVVVKSKSNQFLILLPEVDEEHLDNVLDRIEQGWNEYRYSDYVAIIYEREMVSGEESGLDERKAN
ncbi:MAG: response regulator [Lachnospiraceae bacterium]|nr:response regulator [Lachnospiraceae bacterium]MBR6476005.1 response regulator [Lachnospiraceae bacterium]